ncbi:hypothetical protein GCM10012275_39800 [Longimycelium tulufanense]|uniref:Uncharacterized protein n=1 Tax=Longimycelium tulufanense TaxID=907463 RepID=A0A8J3CAJ2_9PSEU|nr:hypothetical protein [Longimycelium tulufanense]GGM65290.1 hypothetical protein GCM10012275_39800 [Longimycelium tulufanense]
MPDRLIAWLRTVIPTLWTTLLIYLASLGAPDWLLTPLGRAGELVVVPIIMGAVYPLMRAIEPRLPDWLTRILLGSATPPSYAPDRRPSQ